jgi:hypothetical protein
MDVPAGPEARGLWRASGQLRTILTVENAESAEKINNQKRHAYSAKRLAYPGFLR